ncbi:hypothetical protein [Dongshaea marina]|uniref:hypothetical protein n=1 Tax=Dongshaea marina TaxID=2047966 RepID=UPI00131F423F|nr:hypothetical protein [Dongshaea marina]
MILKKGLINTSAPIFIIGASLFSGNVFSSSLDFLTEPDNRELGFSVSCKSKQGLNEYSPYNPTTDTTLPSHVKRFSLESLMPGEAGKYEINCELSIPATGETISSKYEGVKFSESEYGSSAPEFNDDGWAYGVKYTKWLSQCYDTSQAIMIESCMDAFYGNKSYYLNEILGEMSIQWHYHDYSDALGAFITKNTHRRS